MKSFSHCCELMFQMTLDGENITSQFTVSTELKTSGTTPGLKVSELETSGPTPMLKVSELRTGGTTPG